MKQELEESSIQKELALSNMKKKQLEAVAEVKEQIELINRSKQK